MKKIYKTKISDREESSKQIFNFIGSLNPPRLTDVDKLSCEGRITTDECKKALEGMMNNKSPSVSGFSKGFFLYFWPEIGDLVVRYVNEAKNKGLFFPTQRRGVITLIPKKGDQRYLKNKRAICLLDIVYKIVAKVLANRLMLVIDKLVAPDQTGSIRGRFIGNNLRTIADVIYYCKSDRSEGILMALDFQNAFNTVEHEFVYNTLKSFNFGSDFISFVRMLYCGTELAVINNGFTSDWFKTTRGLQQGCPLSAPIFALVVEILALKIRKAEDIQGITVSGQLFTISQYCDDTTVFVKNEASARKVIERVNLFGTYSGLELNLSKCEYMWLGTKSKTDSQICGTAPARKCKILGVWFSASEDCSSDNVEPILTKIERTLNQWRQRDLTLKGKITVGKSLILSKLIYVMAVEQIPRRYLEVIQSHLMKFLWRGRHPKVSKRTLCQAIKAGGLKCPNVMFMYQASRVAWMGRMEGASHLQFSKVFEKRVNSGIREIVAMNFDRKWVWNLQIPEFYKDMLTWFREVVPVTNPVDGRGVRKQCLWNNTAICIDNRPLKPWALMDPEVNYIDNLVDGNGIPMIYEAFVQKYPESRVKRLRYMSLIHAIPRQWKVLLRGSDCLTEQETYRRAMINIKGKLIPLALVKCKYFYEKWISAVTPAAQQRWRDEGFDFGDKWAKIYSLPFSITLSTKLQSLQYRILHRYIPTRRYLCIRNVIEDPFCDHCGQVETLQHLLFNCFEVKQFWDKLATIIKRRTKLTEIRFTVRNVIFGLLGDKEIVNIIVLLGKQFVVSQRHMDRSITVDAFRHVVEKHCKIEKAIAIKNKRFDWFNNRWRYFLSSTGNFIM